MSNTVLTGFHAVEERVRRAADSVAAAKKRGATAYDAVAGMKLLFDKPGPRVKKILALAKEAGIPCENTDGAALDSLVAPLPALARDHRGIVLCIEGEAPAAENLVQLDQWIGALPKDDSPVTVIVLDSVTDPHNVGAIIRSCDQFGANLIVVPERRGASDVSDNDVIARSSAGASAWVPAAVVTNLVRAVQNLKEAGFWIYGADAGGTTLSEIQFAARTAVIMGSEGSGMARLLADQCDSIVSIPTCGKLDSLNVSVAAGVLLYERRRELLAK